MTDDTPTPDEVTADHLAELNGHNDPQPPEAGDPYGLDDTEQEDQ